MSLINVVGVLHDPMNLYEAKCAIHDLLNKKTRVGIELSEFDISSYELAKSFNVDLDNFVPLFTKNKISKVRGGKNLEHHHARDTYKFWFNLYDFVISKHSAVYALDTDNRLLESVRYAVSGEEKNLPKINIFNGLHYEKWLKNKILELDLDVAVMGASHTVHFMNDDRFKVIESYNVSDYLLGTFKEFYDDCVKHYEEYLPKLPTIE